MMRQASDNRPWYRETAMIIVLAVLGATMVSASVIIGFAVTSDDPLVISDQEYQQLRDEFRATEARDEHDDAAEEDGQDDD